MAYAVWGRETGRNYSESVLTIGRFSVGWTVGVRHVSPLPTAGAMSGVHLSYLVRLVLLAFWWLDETCQRFALW